MPSLSVEPEPSKSHERSVHVYVNDAVGGLLVVPPPSPEPSSTVTPKRSSTRSIRLASVRVELPANSSPTGFVPLWLTISEPESPPSLKVPLPIAIWSVKVADAAHMNGPRVS